MAAKYQVGTQTFYNIRRLAPRCTGRLALSAAFCLVRLVAPTLLVTSRRKHAGTGKEALFSAVFEREHAAAPRHHVDDQLCMLPGLELTGADLDRDACDLAELDVVVADNEIISRIAHRR